MQERELPRHRGRGGFQPRGSQQEGKAPTFQVTRGELSHTPKRLTRTRQPQRQALPASRGRAGPSLAWFVVDPSGSVPGLGFSSCPPPSPATEMPGGYPLVRLLHRAMWSLSPLGSVLCLLFSFKNEKEKEREAKVKKENHLQKKHRKAQTKPPTEIHQIHFHKRCERDFLFISWVSGSYKQTWQRAWNKMCTSRFTEGAQPATEEGAALWAEGRGRRAAAGCCRMLWASHTLPSIPSCTRTRGSRYTPACSMLKETSGCL